MAGTLRLLIQGLKPRSPVVPRDGKLHVLVAGHDLKFIGGVVERLSKLDNYEVRIDQWRAFAPRFGRPSIDATAWAHVVVCEWCGGNAVWYSRHKRPGQRLIVRLHRVEVTTRVPYSVNMQAVDQLVTVSPDYQAIVRRQLPSLAPEKVVTIPNSADASVFDRCKLAGSHLHIGMVGAVPKLKRLDLALDILEEVRRHDERFRLFVKSRMPWELKWLWNRADERSYFRTVLKRVQTSPTLHDAVVFDPFGADVATWLRKIGTVLSTSDIESFHVGLLEGMMSAAAAVILPWEGASCIYGDAFVANGVQDASERVLEMARPDAWEKQRRAARRSVERYDLNKVIDAWTRILVEDRDPHEWT